MEINTNEVQNFKIVLLGEGCVGKTSLVLRYVEDKFSSNHISTIQASFLTKKLNIDGRRVNLSIWDTAGQEKFHALGPIYYRSSNGAILVYDITDPDSFEKVKCWVKELRKMLGTEICLIIVGNKTDLEKDRQINVEEVETYAQKVGAIHYQTSAKLNVGVDVAFGALVTKMLQVFDEKEQMATRNSSLSRQGSMRSRNVVVVDDEEVTEGAASTRQCCSSA